MRNEIMGGAILVALIGCGGAPPPTASQSGGSGDDFNDSFFSEGGEQTTPGDHPHGSARELIGIHGPEHPWTEMSHDDKQNEMIGRFLPIMSEIFQEHDATRYASFQ